MKNIFVANFSFDTLEYARVPLLRSVKLNLYRNTSDEVLGHNPACCQGWVE